MTGSPEAVEAELTARTGMLALAIPRSKSSAARELTAGAVATELMAAAEVRTFPTSRSSLSATGGWVITAGELCTAPSSRSSLTAAGGGVITAGVDSELTTEAVAAKLMAADGVITAGVGGELRTFSSSRSSRTAAGGEVMTAGVGGELCTFSSSRSSLTAAGGGVITAGADGELCTCTEALELETELRGVLTLGREMLGVVLCAPAAPAWGPFPRPFSDAVRNAGPNAANVAPRCRRRPAHIPPADWLHSAGSL